MAEVISLRQFDVNNDYWISVANSKLKLKSHEFEKKTFTLKVIFILYLNVV